MPGYPNEHSDREDDFDDDPSEEEYDESEECGRWDNGKLVVQCALAGTEWCDWQCPIGLPHRAKRRR